MEIGISEKSLGKVKIGISNFILTIGKQYQINGEPLQWKDFQGPSQGNVGDAINIAHIWF